MPDPTSSIRFSSVFPKKARIILVVQNRPGSYLNGLVRVWLNSFWSRSKAGVQESADPVSGRRQPALYQSVSHFQTRFRSSTDVPDNIMQNQPGSDLVLADCVRFWPNGSGPEASRRCALKNHPSRFWPMLYSRS